ncbi:hypothetical protein AB0N17_18710 [Streptomyces sp. NPDC051133]|uniref:hypothetical protein n=1 Tax=Streptomyces sp. NPDC051133 TaxID=3155521 RepID=UPI00342216EF
MSGRTDSDTGPAITEAATDEAPTAGPAVSDVTATEAEEAEAAEDAEDGEEHIGDARKARWAAAGTGGLLTLAGLAAALLRLTGSEPALVPAAYGLGAAVCALAAVLGARGRTRRALWLLVAGTMVMAFGDQSD